MSADSTSPNSASRALPSLQGQSATVPSAHNAMLKESSAEEGSVTTWIKKLTDGDEQAAQKIWSRYFEPLAAVGRQRRRNAPSAPEDEDDVVISALWSFFRRTQAGQFQELRDRNNLWALLVTITERKAINQRQRLLAKKRGGSTTVQSVEQIENQISLTAKQFAGPSTIAEMNDWLQFLLERLEDASLCDVAKLKLQGYSNREIAKEIDRSIRTVENRLRLIRKIWAEEIKHNE